MVCLYSRFCYAYWLLTTLLFFEQVAVPNAINLRGNSYLKILYGCCCKILFLVLRPVPLTLIILIDFHNGR